MILDEKGDYVFPVKENQSNLYKNIRSFFAPEYPNGNDARVLSNINNLILALIRQAGFLNAAQARRLFAAHLSLAFTLLVTPFS